MVKNSSMERFVFVLVLVLLFCTFQIMPKLNKRHEAYLSKACAAAH
jgi:hypothetical protein